MPLIPFPDIPDVPGVPALPRTLTLPSLDTLSGTGLADLAQAIAPPWGIYDKNGELALAPDSFIGLDYKNESRVSDYPQEPNSFASYNKVFTPYDARVRMAIAADRATRTQFLAACEWMVRSIDLYSVITPETSYLNATLISFDYRREVHGGVSQIVVDLWLREVRQVAKSMYSKSGNPALPADQVKSVNGASPQSTGQVQPATPTTAQAGALQ